MDQTFRTIRCGHIGRVIDRDESLEALADRHMDGGIGWEAWFRIQEPPLPSEAAIQPWVILELEDGDRVMVPETDLSRS